MSDSRLTLTCPLCEYRVSLNDPLSPDLGEEHRSRRVLREHIAEDHPAAVWPDSPVGGSGV